MNFCPCDLEFGFKCMDTPSPMLYLKTLFKWTHNVSVQTLISRILANKMRILGDMNSQFVAAAMNKLFERGFRV